MYVPIPFETDLSVEPEVKAFFDATTNTVSYVVGDPNSKSCAGSLSARPTGLSSKSGCDALSMCVTEHRPEP